jgi:hypothetical protein
MSAVYTSGLGTYLWDGVNQSQTGQAGGVVSVGSSAPAYSGSAASIDVASISDRAQLFSGLEILSRSNPARFHKNTAMIGEYLHSAAQSSEDPDESSILTGTAASFERASETGDFSDLFLYEAHGLGSGQAEPSAVAQIFAHVLPQVLNDAESSAARSRA